MGTRKPPVEFAYDETNKEFVKRYKMFFSSLFARKMKYIYLDVENPTSAIYTTISAEELLIGKPSIDDAIHRVDTDEDLVKLLDTCLPFELMESRYYCVDLSELADLKRKHETVDTRKANINLYMEVGDDSNICISKTKIKKIDKVPTPLEHPIYYMVDSLHIEYLNTMIDTVVDWVNKSPHMEEISLVPKDLHKSEINYTNTDVHMIDGFKGIRLPLFDGFNSVSSCEFGKKQDNGSLNVMIGVTGTILRAVYRFTCPLVKVISVQPTSLFPLKCTKK